MRTTTVSLLFILSILAVHVRADDEQFRSALTTILRNGMVDGLKAAGPFNVNSKDFSGRVEVDNPEKNLRVSVKKFALAADKISIVAEVSAALVGKGKIRPRSSTPVDAAFDADVWVKSSLEASVRVDGIDLCVDPILNDFTSAVKIKKLKPESLSGGSKLLTTVLNAYLAANKAAIIKEINSVKRMGETRVPLTKGTLSAAAVAAVPGSRDNPNIRRALELAVLTELRDRDSQNPWTNTPKTKTYPIRIPAVEKTIRVPAVKKTIRVPAVEKTIRVPAVKKTIRVPAVEKTVRVPAVEKTIRIPAVEKTVFGKRIVITPAYTKRIVVTPAFTKRVVITPAFDKKVVVTPAFDKKIVVTPAFDKKIIVTPAFDKKIVVTPEIKVGTHTHESSGKTWIKDPGKLQVHVRRFEYADGVLHVDFKAEGRVRSRQKYKIRNVLSTDVTANASVVYEARVVLEGWTAEVTYLRARLRNLSFQGIDNAVNLARVAGHPYVTKGVVEEVVEASLNELWIEKNRGKMRKDLTNTVNTALDELLMPEPSQ